MDNCIHEFKRRRNPSTQIASANTDSTQIRGMKKDEKKKESGKVRLNGAKKKGSNWEAMKRFVLKNPEGSRKKCVIVE